MKNTTRNANSVHIINPNEGVRRSIVKNSKVKNQKSKSFLLLAQFILLNKIDTIQECNASLLVNCDAIVE